jgi:hypothetical protein
VRDLGVEPQPVGRMQGDDRVRQPDTLAVCQRRVMASLRSEFRSTVSLGPPGQGDDEAR